MGSSAISDNVGTEPNLPTKGFPGELINQVSKSVDRFINWRKEYGEASYDVDDFFNGSYGRWAKRQYYKFGRIGIIPVAPLVFLEAFFPAARRFFWKKQRTALADAHYAMGFAYLHNARGAKEYYDTAVGLLESLIATRCPGYKNYCWGYPFDWETVIGTFSSSTPLITTTPYVYEAFEAVYLIDGNKKWLDIMRSIADHAVEDYRKTEFKPGIYASSYTPFDNRRVVNANAYRAFLLTAAAERFQHDRYSKAADQSLRFVLAAQSDDGGWLYAIEDVDAFIDHFHTCFVMKALAKIKKLTGNPEVSKALENGLNFYFNRLIDENYLPKPFAKPPRLVIYHREIYDLAEATNLSLLLSKKRPELLRVREACLRQTTGEWQKPDGSLRTRKLWIGWNNVPMHRWGSSITFRSWCLFLKSAQESAA